jgi:hypothetical protein
MNTAFKRLVQQNIATPAPYYRSYRNAASATAIDKKIERQGALIQSGVEIVD